MLDELDLLLDDEVLILDNGPGLWPWHQVLATVSFTQGNRMMHAQRPQFQRYTWYCCACGKDTRCLFRLISSKRNFFFLKLHALTT